jgi:hypothetical protein
MYLRLEEAKWGGQWESRRRVGSLCARLVEKVERRGGFGALVVLVYG